MRVKKFYEYKNDLIKGGLSDKSTIEDIAKKHNVSISDIENQLKKGIKVEKEHTGDVEMAKEIAMDHLFEIPDYYDRLEKIESKIFESKEEIKTICQKYGIENYTINHDGTVDVDGDVNLSNKKLIKLPLKFGKVGGYFYCQYNQLTSLDGCPKEVGGAFNCQYNQLTSLEGGPKEVSGNFYCYNNQLTSLEGGPQEVGGDFLCQYNQLTSLDVCPKYVGGHFNCNYNQLKSLEGCPEVVGGEFSCSDNQLTSLEGCPEKVGGNFYCGYNKLTSLEGCPEEVGAFYCGYNKLTSLEGCPKVVGGYFYCFNNQITIVKNELQFINIGGDFEIEDNTIYNIYKLFPDFKSFQDSLDYNYFREPNLIVKHRFEEACGEAGIEVPEKIEGYKYI